MDKNDGLEIVEFQETGYQALLEYEEWRVAALKFCDDLRPENIKTMQKHDETDEVFVLLDGKFSLLLGGDGTQPENMIWIPLERNKLYNVKKGVWHNHIMEEGGVVLIVENSSTFDDNSPIVPLTKEQLKFLGLPRQ